MNLDNTPFTQLKKHFANELGSSSEAMHYFFAPGRVNLIGEYTDFNGGFVLPCALQLGTYLIVKQNSSKLFRIFSTNCDEQISLTLDELKETSSKRSDWAWANYPIGLLKHFENELSTLGSGLDFFFMGTIPLASGLSSSASIEVLSAFALNTILHTNYSLLELVLMAQQVENNFIGVSCGVMDQYSIAFGKDGHAIRIDCQNLNHEWIPLHDNPGQEYGWLIINSNRARKLSESKYNERRQECQQALNDIQKSHTITQLCEFPYAQIDSLNILIPDCINRKRAAHVIEEHHRVIEGSKLLEKGELKNFAKLMNQSHESLSKKFEVSGETLDRLVNISQNTDGVIGARMTGAGFGGCTINLIEKNKKEQIINSIKKQYLAQTGIEADAYPVYPSQGVQQVILNEQ